MVRARRTDDAALAASLALIAVSAFARVLLRNPRSRVSRFLDRPDRRTR